MTDSTAELPLTEEVDDPTMEQLDEESADIVFDITSYGADYDVDGLIRRMKQGHIVVPTFQPDSHDNLDVDAFQRRFVWSPTQMSKFVESLLLGLPVPGIFLVKNHDNRLLVLDGQQRLRTLERFRNGMHKDKKFKLIKVSDQFEGLGYEDLQPEDQRRFDDSIIHATVLQNMAESSRAVYSIYQRLNTGGATLQPHEIRIALNHGKFLAGISLLNSNDAWRDLYGPNSSRLRDHELILRILALYENLEKYKRPLKSFLDDYLENNKDRKISPEMGMGRSFSLAAKWIADNLGRLAFRPVRNVSAAQVDAIMVGLMHRADNTDVIDGDKLRDAYNLLMADSDFIEATRVGTSASDALEYRINHARDAFKDI